MKKKLLKIKDFQVLKIKNFQVLIGSLLIMIFLISGCTVSEYLTGKVPEKSYSLLTEKEEIEEEAEEIEEEEITDIEKIIEEISEEIEEEALEEEAVEEALVEEVIEEEVEEALVEEVIEEEIDEESFIKITVKENEKVRLKPKATDADEDTLTYTFSEPLDENGGWQTTHGDAGNYLITVTASDGKLTTTKKVLLAVERVNVPPVIKDIEKDITIDEGDTLTLAPKITDPNGDMVTVTISDPIGNDGVWEIDYQEHGEYNVTITATDGELETIETIKVVVNKKNVPPSIEYLEDIEIDEGETVTIVPVVADLNGDDITVTISEPIGDEGIWETGFTDHGVYEITVKATDGLATSSKTLTLTVNDINKAPEIIDIILE